MLPAEGEIAAAVAAPGVTTEAVGTPLAAEPFGEGVPLCGTVPAGAGGRGAETPAMSDPSPSFCKLGASSFPLGSIPFADWNFCIAAIVFESHLPLGSPW
jgi:hypothetical protein